MKAPGMWDRTVPLAQTVALIPALRERFGITRLGDTTWLDRTGIPTFCAVVPASSDLISVYNGKGLTRDAAVVSAVMEAVERQVAADPRIPTFRESVRRVCEFIDLETLGLKANARDLVVDCTEGIDLLSGERLPVPLAMVQCPWFGETLFNTTDTNGLASGNTPDEAVYHALSELLERHIWSLYHAKCHLVPRYFMGPGAGDLSLASEIELPAGIPVIDSLVERIDRAGLRLRALWLAEAGLPTTVLASVTELSSDPPMAHVGLGCSLVPEHALSRALTEAVQSRVVDIQAAREDILRSDEPTGKTGEYARRLSKLPVDRWYYDLAAPRVPLAAIDGSYHDDIADDIRHLLAGLRTIGATRAIVVNLSPRDVPVSVVRMIVPALETGAINGRIGPLALSLFNPFYVKTSRSPFSTNVM